MEPNEKSDESAGKTSGDRGGSSVAAAIADDGNNGNT